MKMQTSSYTGWLKMVTIQPLQEQTVAFSSLLSQGEEIMDLKLSLVRRPHYKLVTVYFSFVYFIFPIIWSNVRIGLAALP